LVAIPTRCVWWEAGADECDVRLHLWRPRNTGPCHPLAVLKCHHGSAFTLYPPGYGPYKRKSVAPMSGAGEVARIGGDVDGGKEIGEPAYEGTVHGAAMDASRGERWPRESPADDPRRRRTQDRYIAQSAMLLGLANELAEQVAQDIAECLCVPYLALSDLRNRYSTALTYQEKGAAIVSALALIPADRTLGDRLLQSGFIGGMWRHPVRWDPG
jgi:hypothetical protein